MKKIVSIIILVCMILGGLKIIPLFSEGYKMYREATNEVPIDTMVEKIRNDDSYVSLDEISDEFLYNLIKIEDRRFKLHFGFDLISMARATYNNIKAGRIVEGGSTITQQLAKNMYFSFEKTFQRKIAEVIVAINLERKYSKEDILELYCNEIYFGEDCYGIKEAANHYYNKSPKKLNSIQSCELVNSIKCPELYNPKQLNNAA